MTEINLKQIMYYNYETDNLLQSVIKCMQIASEQTKQACISQIDGDGKLANDYKAKIKNNVIIK